MGLDGGCDTSNVNPLPEFDRSTGKTLKQFGAGLFALRHGIQVDREGNVWITDSVVNEAGTYYQSGRVSGLFIDDDDTLYAIDSETSTTRHPGWTNRIRIGNAKADEVTAFIPPHDSGESYGAAGEGVAVDPNGNVYGAEGRISRETAEGGLTKYLKR